ncbi:MAG: AAA family ATPase [Cypionkella sp.]
MTEINERINSVAPLANVARLRVLIERCQNRANGLPGMGCFYGQAGLGKTFSATYATNAFDACHVSALPIGGVKGLLTMIVNELGLRPARTTDALFAQAVQQLALTQRPLIIDEADHILHDKPIEIARLLHDSSGVAVILMGEEAMPQKLQQWARVHSRILSWVGAEQATMADLDHLARIYAPGVTLSPDLKSQLLAASHGSIRNVSTNLAHVREFAAVQGLTKIDVEGWARKPFHTGVAPAPRTFGAIKKGAAA